MLSDMASRLKAGETVLDIGANIGNHALFLVHVARARVLAFEPNTEHCETINRCIELNNCGEMLSVYNLALGSTDGEGQLVFVNPQNTGEAQVKLGSGDVKVKRVDSLSMPDRVAMLKIDVEGMELEVLKGASETLKRDRPLIYSEFLSLEKAQAAYSYLRDFGYTYVAVFDGAPSFLFAPSTTSITMEEFTQTISGFYQKIEIRRRKGRSWHKKLRKRLKQFVKKVFSAAP